MDLTEFLTEFKLEAGEKLDVIASQLLKLERDATDLQPVREMFLAAHTIKGGAAMLRLTEVESLAHALEDLLSAVRDERRQFDAATADLLFAAIDRLRALVASATSESVGVEPDATLAAFAAELRRAVNEPEAELRRALVVEPSPTVRELHRMLLEDAGYEVELCGTGEASRRAVPGRFCLVVASVQQHETIDGFELSSALRGSEVRVILTSADADAGMARRSAESGAYALVRKGSWRDSQLRQVLQQLAGG